MASVQKEMDLRAKMRRIRHDRELKLEEMAHKLKISTNLLAIVEEGGVTSLSFASRIGEEYGLTPEEIELLIPLHKRPNGGDYDPDRYKVPDHMLMYSGTKREERIDDDY